VHLVSTKGVARPSDRQRRRAVGVLIVIALIPLGAAVSELRSAYDLTGSTSHVAGQIGAPSVVVPPFSKSGARRHYDTSIRLAGGSTVTVDDQELFDAVKQGDRVDVEIRGGGTHVAAVRVADGRRIVISDSLTGALVFAAVWAALAAAIVTAALLLGGRARRSVARA
jgi:hypothetical protein